MQGLTFIITSVTRALFCAALLWLPAEASAQTLRLRLASSNLTSGNAQSYDSGEGSRILQGIDPDVAFMQEFNYGTNSTADIRTFVNNSFGTTFSYFREAGAQIPNGIVSRYPILSSGEWNDTEVSNRDFAWARIDLPGSHELWAISVHLLTTSSGERNTEATNLVAYIRANVPAGDYVAIGGDFNVDTRSESALTTLGGAVVTTGPYPADRNGNSNTNAARAKPYDGVFVSGSLSGYSTSVKIGNSTFANGLVADTRVYSPISEISPALASDSDAVNMQHMSVVRDFLIPVPEPSAVVLMLFGVLGMGCRRPRG